ncbi:hypothetical protein [Allomuricauda sp. M10]|uniref:hypothetical protein n=1 Tax=Allomuricauda sp. M10 TaxID=2683292 RepID=UPI001D1822EA|nr:hypothetical protein [Muricauda sp. M10]
MEGNTYQGLEIFEVNGQTNFALLHLRRKKGELDIMSSKTFVSFEELSKSIAKNYVLQVVLNTGKVLTKAAPMEATGTPDHSVHQAFPNLDMELFYYQVFDSHSFRMVSITKKTIVDTLLDELEGYGIFPTHVSLGISDIELVLPFHGLPIQGSNFILGEGTNENQPLKHIAVLNKEKMDVQGLELPKVHLLGFASILRFLFPSNEKHNMSGINSILANRFKNGRFYKMGLCLGLGSILTILIINFLVFSHYRSLSTDLQGPIDLEQQAELVQKVKARVLDKEKKLSSILGSNNTHVTKFLDQIGSSIPETVLLEVLDYQPLLRPIQQKKPISLEKGQILVSGFTKDKMAFSEWTANLEQMDGIGAVEIQGYEYTTTNTDHFLLKIALDATGQ